MFSHQASGLYLTLNRAYDPYSGRWLSRDPAGEQVISSTNLYAYVGDNPVNLTDANGLCPSKQCSQALATAGQNQSALQNVAANWSVVQNAASTNGISPALLAAIGVRETGFNNIKQIGGGQGAGVFQIDLGQNPSVSSAQAFNISYAANYAAKTLAGNMVILGSEYPGLTPPQLLQATAASYNLGVGGISGNPNTIDVGTPNNNYGSNVMNLMSCFQ
jgi:RHS repeat-associated protein